MEENLRSARERFNVSRVRREKLDDLFCDAVFPADVWDRPNHLVREDFSTFEEMRFDEVPRLEA